MSSLRQIKVNETSFTECFFRVGAIIIFILGMIALVLSESEPVYEWDEIVSHCRQYGNIFYDSEVINCKVNDIKQP